MPYTSLTWAAIRERLKQRFEGVPYWTDPEALIAFNEGLRTFNLLTGRWTRRETIATTAGTYLYTASASMLYKARVVFDLLPLSPSNREDLNNSRYTWRQETTATGGDVPTRPMIWAPISTRSFYLWPADAVGGHTLTLDGVSATPVLSEEADTLDLGDELLNVLLGYGLHSLSFGKGGQFFEATQPYWLAFLAACAEENSQLKASQFYRRAMGLDDRSFKPLRGVATAIDAHAAPNVLEGGAR